MHNIYSVDDIEPWKIEKKIEYLFRRAECLYLSYDLEEALKILIPLRKKTGNNKIGLRINVDVGQNFVSRFGIDITDNVISNTGISRAPWGDIIGNLEDQEDLVQKYLVMRREMKNLLLLKKDFASL